MYYRFILLISLWFFACACQSSDAPPRTGSSVTHKKQFSDTLKGKVVKISDGDTFHLLLDDNSQQKIRLYGVDCPERKQPYHQVAKQHLSSLIFSRYIVVINKGTDRFGRVVGIVNIGNEVVNELMLQAGLAWHFKRYDRNPAWDRLEKEAAAKKLGLWADQSPTPPWQWRKN